MKRVESFVFALAVMLALGGCWTSPCHSTGGMEISQSEGGRSAQYVDDPCFGEWLRVESALAHRTPSGMLQAQVNLRNVKRDADDDKREDDFTAQYEMRWFDAKGFEVLPDSCVWRRLTWHGGEARAIKECAPTPDAVRYVLRLRHAK